MKNRTTEEQILLAQSGELTGRDRAQLERALADDSTGRAYRDDLDQLARTLREQATEAEVSELTLQRIRTAAEQAVRPARTQVSWSPALAYAAAGLALLACGLFMAARLGQQDTPKIAQEAQPPLPEGILAWDADLDAEIEALDEMMAMTFDDTAENESTQESLEELAEQLIELEGIQI
jgi:hypothetical protein